MSIGGHKPEHLIIRRYINKLVDGDVEVDSVITETRLVEAFVPAYMEMVPPGEDVPEFKIVHRHDDVKTAARKVDANFKKLWRAINGETYFPLVFRDPLIVALDKIRLGLGLRLEKLLLRNRGLFHIPVNMSAAGAQDYMRVLSEFSEANTAMVEDMADDGELNNPKTAHELMDSIEAQMNALRRVQGNCDKGEGKGD